MKFDKTLSDNTGMPFRIEDNRRYCIQYRFTDTDKWINTGTNYREHIFALDHLHHYQRLNRMKINDFNRENWRPREYRTKVMALHGEELIATREQDRFNARQEKIRAEQWEKESEHNERSRINTLIDFGA